MNVSVNNHLFNANYNKSIKIIQPNEFNYKAINSSLIHSMMKMYLKFKFYWNHIFTFPSKSFKITEMFRSFRLKMHALL